MSFSNRTDSLYVISDLHLGGLPGGQIFKSTDALVLLLKHISKTARNSPDEICTLLINGDFVDFLAEPRPTYFDPHGAAGRLDRIFMGEPAFKGILGGLHKFARTPNCRLIINLGNHDLELALPWVRTHLIDLISHDDPDARANIELVVNGAACLFSLSGRQIYCAHGNEVDAWNVTNHERIRRIGQDILRGENPESWIPNGGTQLVIDVMNEIKLKYPFVDLLKPETGAVIPLLAALDPSLVKVLGEFASTVRKMGWDKVMMQSGFLGDTQFDRGPGSDGSGFEMTPLGENIVQGDSTAMSRNILVDANTRFAQSVAPMDLIDEDEIGDQLGIFSSLTAKVAGRTLSEQLRLEMQKLHEDTSFDLAFQDEQFEQFDRIVGSNIDVIVTGHSHLRRAVSRKRGSGYYFNTGTWARLMQVDKTQLNNQSAFDRFFNAIQAGRLQALDDEPGLVKCYNPVFSAKVVDNAVQVQLNRVATDSKKAIELVPNTQFALG